MTKKQSDLFDGNTPSIAVANRWLAIPKSGELDSSDGRLFEIVKWEPLFIKGESEVLIIAGLKARYVDSDTQGP